MANRPCEYEELTREFYEAINSALKFKARSCGYALLTHGSLKTDIDLVAVPWREGAISQESLAEKIRQTVKEIIGTADDRKQPPTKKPNGRLAYSFYLVPPACRGPYIDLSIFPPMKDKEVK